MDLRLCCSRLRGCVGGSASLLLEIARIRRWICVSVARIARIRRWICVSVARIGINQVHYVNVSVLIVFTKDQCFYLYYHKFSIKSYVLDVY